jgi:Zn-dependent peptidase ImmA (M78 family)/plasmid maintenance system antidote protein VapI
MSQGELFAPAANPNMVVLGRELRGLNQNDLAPKLNLSQAHLSRLEAGLSPVGDDIVMRLSKQLHLPEDFFKNNDSVYGPTVAEFFHRKRQSASSSEVNRLHAQLNKRRMELSRLLRAADIGELNFPRLDPREFDSIEDIAAVVRAAWLLPSGPISNMTQAIERAGGIVMVSDFGTRMIDAISQWVPRLPPIFFVNRNAAADRVRMTLAHELGHIVMHQTPHAGMEDEAKKFAAAFLMPERDIRLDFHKVTLERLAALKPYWKVSMQGLLYRATEIATITDRQARSLWVKMGKFGFRNQEPPELDLSPEQPVLLREIVDLHVRQFGFSSEEIGRTVQLFEDEASEIYGLSQSDIRLRVVR